MSSKFIVFRLSDESKKNGAFLLKHRMTSFITGFLQVRENWKKSEFEWSDEIFFL